MAGLSSQTIPSPRDLAWGYPPFPDWLMDFRPTQWEGAQEVIELFRQGYRTVFAEAPTGSGKTAMAEIVRRELNTRALYLCSTKQLQSQIEDRFPYAAVLWGRQNYETRNYPGRFPDLNASFCDKDPDHVCDRCMGEFDGKTSCTFCCPSVNECPYEQAKSVALREKLAVLNYAYFCIEANYVGRFGEQFSKQTGELTRNALVVADEADLIEEELMGFVALEISPRRRKQFDIPTPARKTVEAAWIEWATLAYEHLGRVLKRYPVRSSDLRRLKDRQWLVRTKEQLARLAEGLPNGGWVYDDRGGEAITFRPVTVAGEAQKHLWRHADRWLCMSATICAPQVMANDLGLEDGTWASFSLPSPFDVRRRPIYVVPRANMKRDTRDVEWPKMVEAVAELLRNYPAERVLIPTVSYELNNYLIDGLSAEFGSRIVTYTSSMGRQKALDQFRRQPAAILFAPSMDRGVDMSDEDCRVVIIVKVPYPYKGDKQIAKRLYTAGGENWYTVQTIRRIVQATGRGMRHAGDYCDVFILDGAFTRLYRSHGHWFPRWWREAIDWKRGGRDALKTPGNARAVAEGG